MARLAISISPFSGLPYGDFVALAREAGVKSYGTAVVQIGANKQEAKGLTEEGITGAFIRDNLTAPPQGRARRGADGRL